MIKTEYQKTNPRLAAANPAPVVESETGFGGDACLSPFMGCEAGGASQVEGSSSAPAMPIWKRGLDCFCIFLSLPVLLPFVLLVVAWIKIVSRGPVLFSQDRVGRAGRRFLLYKFRSMEKSAATRRHEDHFQALVEEDRPMVKLDTIGDQRLIFGGSILRTLGLDELPQLINVIRGEMSIVGPRPCLPKEYNLYDVDQRERFNAVPGLTGYWQVNGKNKTKFTEMVQMDIHYTRKLSLGLDLKIMCMTIPAILDQAMDSYARKREEQAGSVSPVQVEPTLTKTGAE